MFLDEYRKRLFLIGRAVDVVSYSGERIATVTALNDDLTLQVRYDDGTENALNSGEVRLRVI